eukprot:m.133619 g.133619  ORF g.133619 m.133619 type:complete len:237 (+) comp20104_c0_seq1:131-841(+)
MSSSSSPVRRPPAEESSTFKVVLVGAPAVGKTAFVRQYVHDEFSERTIATVGVDYDRKVLQTRPGHEIVLQLWDIGGYERPTDATSQFYRGAHGALVFFDSSNSTTLSIAARWYHHLSEFYADQELPLLLIGNKIDAPSLMSNDEIESFCKSESIEKWFLVSARTGINVDLAMRTLTVLMLERHTHVRQTVQDLMNLSRASARLNSPGRASRELDMSRDQSADKERVTDEALMACC